MIPVEVWGLALTLPPTAALMGFSSWLYNRHLDEVAERYRAHQRQQTDERVAAARKRQQASPEYAAKRDAGADARDRERVQRQARKNKGQARKDQERAAREAAVAKKRTDVDALKAKMEILGVSEVQYSEHSTRRTNNDRIKQRRGKAVVSEWLSRCGLIGNHDEQLARAEGVERQILKLPINEQAVVILFYGLLDGLPLDQAKVAKRLDLAEHSVWMIRVRALAKIDLLHIHAAESDFERYIWWDRGNCWFKCWTADSDWPPRRRQSALLPGMRAIVVERSQGWISYYHTQRFGSLNEGTLVEENENAPGAFYVTSTGIALLWLPGEERLGSIDSVEYAHEVEILLRQLSAVERQVICMTFGIGSAGCFSTSEISAVLDLTALATRQIELTALAKLRAAVAQHYGTGVP